MEDYQFVDATFVELINSLLSSGEVPGLYSPDELEAILSPLREESSQESFRGSMVQYFAQRTSNIGMRQTIDLRISILGVKTNLHIVLVMDFTRATFTMTCQSNPGFFKECAVQWMDGWSEKSMMKVNERLPVRIRSLACLSLRFQRCCSPKNPPTTRTTPTKIH